MPHKQLRVVFDLDDTLYAERDFAVSGFEAASTWARDTFGTPDFADEMTALLDPGHLGNLFGLTLTKHVPQHSDAELREFIDAYRSHLPTLSLYEDAHQALAVAADCGAIGLITDGTEFVQRNKVQALGIEHHFAKIIYTSSLGGRAFHKPNPLAFELMEAALGADNVQFVYVGDNPAKDFVAPNARGWMSVQINRPHGIHDHTAEAPGGAPAYQVDSLAEFAELVVRL